MNLIVSSQITNFRSINFIIITLNQQILHMDYRYQETLAWIIPGFYLIILGIIILFIFQTINEDVLKSYITFIKDYEITDALTVVLVFMIPIVSLIVGWIINAIAGRLFHLRTLQFKQVLYGKCAVYKYCRTEYENSSLLKRKCLRERYFQEYCDAKQELNLDLVDRTYYRYVFSRNMFTSQLLISIIWFFGSIYTKQDCCKILGGSIILFVISALYYFVIVDRDLLSHAKFVFAEHKRLKEKKEVES